MTSWALQMDFNKKRKERKWEVGLGPGLRLDHEPGFGRLLGARKINKKKKRERKRNKKEKEKGPTRVIT